MKKIDDLYQLGQSIWIDNISRGVLKDGSFAKMITDGLIHGVTSNPSIFNNAIAKSNDYDTALRTLAWSGFKTPELFWELAVKDIQDAADLFLPVYKETGRKDGFVSLEVNPLLANDTKNTVSEAKRLWEKVNRPNLMVKIPATKEGIPAIRQSIANGININITLIFSLERYQAVMDAFMSGLEDRLAAGKEIDHIASVASFFVSRVDSKVDGYLGDQVKSGSATQEQVNGLLGKAAIANAKLAYELFLIEFNSPRFQALQRKGAQLQRPLWASTSTKNPNYRDVMYVEDLIGDNTVNTVPPATLTAMMDHGNVKLTIDTGLEDARNTLKKLEELNISMKQVTDELEVEGVKAFSDAFNALFAVIEERRSTQLKYLGGIAPAVEKRLTKLHAENVIQRMYDHDPSLWTNDPTGQAEIRERMDWLMAPWQSEELLPDLKSLLKESRQAGFTKALLLGMGGSSLAPEVLRLISGVSKNEGLDGLDLDILDSTNPLEVQQATDRFEVGKTLFIVSSKSGSTGEINAFYQYFWKLVTEKFGDKAGKHFIAITDPGTKLDKLAREKGFWKVFNANPRVGGRNSALTAFGLVPATLIGIDPVVFLQKAQSYAIGSLPASSAGEKLGIVLGVILAEAALAGRDKLTIVSDTPWKAFGNWLEQLVAESSGKLGKGIVPIANEPQVEVKRYGIDRIFTYIRVNGENDTFIDQLIKSGHPVVVLDVLSNLDLGGHFYIWEVAVAIACSILGINSFDQPDVQDAKTRTLDSISAFRKTGKLEQGSPLVKLAEGDVFSNQKIQFDAVKTLRESLDLFLSKMLKPDDYVAINAFLPRNNKTEVSLEKLRKQILEQFGNATTLGFGPRFLHSTGQLHKGGPNNGVFIEITSDSKSDMEIPGEGLTFGTMSLAQVLGDYQALDAKGRRLLRVHLTNADPDLLFK